MAIVQVGSSTDQSNSGTATLVLADPGTAGAFLIVLFASDTEGQTWTPPDGTWTNLFADTVGFDGEDVAVWWKQSATGSGSYTFTLSTAADRAAVMLAFTGVATTSPINASSNNAVSTGSSSGSAVTGLAVSATVANTMLVWMVGMDSNTPSTVGVDTWTAPSGFGAVVAAGGTGSGGDAFNQAGCASHLISATGSTGNQSGTWSLSGATFGYGGYLIALAPAGGGGGGLAAPPFSDTHAPARARKWPESAAGLAIPPLVFPQRLPFMPGDVAVRPPRSRDRDTLIPLAAPFAPAASGFLFFRDDGAPRAPRSVRSDRDAPAPPPPLVFGADLPFAPGDVPPRAPRGPDRDAPAGPPPIFVRGATPFTPGEMPARQPRGSERDLPPAPPPIVTPAGAPFVPGDIPPRPPRRPETWTWSVPPPVVVPFALPFSPGELPVRAPRFTDAWAWKPPPPQLGRFGALFFAESPPVPRPRWPDQATWEIPPPLVLSFATSFDPGVMPPRPPRARSADMLTWPPSALAAAPALVSFAFSDLQAMLRARRARPDDQPWIPSVLAAQVALAGFAFAPGDGPPARVRVTPAEGTIFAATSLPAAWTPGAVLELPARRARLRPDADTLVLSFPVFGWAPPAAGDAPAARARMRPDETQAVLSLPVLGWAPPAAADAPPARARRRAGDDGATVAVRVAAIWVPSSPADMARARRFLEVAPGAAPLPVPLPILPWTPSADHYVPRRRQRPVWVELDFGPLGSRIFVPGRLVQHRRDGGTHSARSGSGRTSRRPTK